jgi:hypothetical protein
VRETADLRRQVEELRQRTRDGERQLRPGSEPRMTRKSAMDVQPHAAIDPVMRQEPRCEIGGSPRVLTADRHAPGASGRHEQRRGRRGGAEAAEPPPTRAPKIEDAEMQPRRRLDEDLPSVP